MNNHLSELSRLACRVYSHKYWDPRGHGQMKKCISCGEGLNWAGDDWGSAPTHRTTLYLLHFPHIQQCIYIFLHFSLIGTFILYLH